MNKSDILSTAVKNLWRKKLRTGLTVLGALIGTFSIIIMLGLSMGISKTNSSMLSNMGSIYNIEVYPSGEEIWFGFEKENSGNKKDVKVTDQIIYQIEKIKYVDAVMPIINVQGQLQYKNYSISGEIIGIDYNLAEFFNKKTKSGEPINNFPKNNIFLGAEIVNNIYNERTGGYAEIEELPPLQGQYGEIRSISFNEFDEELNNSKEIKEKIIIGDFLEKTGNWMDDIQIIIPMDLALDFQKKVAANDPKLHKKIKKGEYEKAIVRVNDESKVKEVQDQINTLGVTTQSMQNILESFNQGNKIIQFILGGIGSIAFIVAAIGIANTMVMSIYERVKEIGIMKVIGATVNDIKSIFLTEAALIGFFGGILGTLLATLTSFIINKLYKSLQNPEIMPDFEVYLTHIPFWLIIIGILFSTFVGILAGYIPAVKATKISAIDAIRTE